MTVSVDIKTGEPIEVCSGVEKKRVEGYKKKVEFMDVRESDAKAALMALIEKTLIAKIEKILIEDPYAKAMVDMMRIVQQKEAIALWAFEQLQARYGQNNRPR